MMGDDILQRVCVRVQDSMDEILTNFSGEAKITVLVRTPGKPTADFCMTSDDLDKVLAMVHRRKGDAPTPAPQVAAAIGDIREALGDPKIAAYPDFVAAVKSALDELMWHRGQRSYAAGRIDGFDEAIKLAAGEAYRVCAETRHVTLGESAARAIRALSMTKPDACTPASHLAVAYSQAEYDEAYEIGKRDGYEEAVQDIDQKTGGDGEYRYCLGMEDDIRHQPDAATMIQRIVDRFETLNLLDEATRTGSGQPDDAPAPAPRVRGYLHRLVDTKEWNISLPSQMENAWAYQKLWPSKIEIVPLVASAASEDQSNG